MKRFGSLGLAVPLALGAAACGANTTPAPPVTWTKHDMFADFEGGDAGTASLTANPHWKATVLAALTGGADVTPNSKPYAPKAVPLNPPRVNPDGSLSSFAFEATEDGSHTQWGSAWVSYPNEPYNVVDLSDYTGISLWARSLGMPGTTLRVQLADYGSFVFMPAGDPRQLCDPNDSALPGLAPSRQCYDDYAMRIYPDGEWRRFDIPFSSLTTGGWGWPHPFDSSKVYALKFVMLPGAAYDIMVDDILFYRN